MSSENIKEKNEIQEKEEKNEIKDSKLISDSNKKLYIFLKKFEDAN